MHHEDCWAVLGIEPTADRAAIKRAYAAQLKTLDRERDVEAFQALRAAYEEALFLIEELRPESAPMPERMMATPSVELRVPLSAPGACETSSVEVERLVPSGTIEQAASRILALLRVEPTAESTMRVLAASPELENLHWVDLIGEALVRQLVDSEELPASVLAVLAERFCWRDVQWLRRFPPALASAIPRWLRRVEHRERIRHGQVAEFSRKHYQRLDAYLSPPFGFWRAFRIGLLPLLKLDQSVESVRRELGSDWDVVITPDMHEFHLGVRLKRFAPELWAGVLLGRLALFAVLALLVSAVALSVPGGNAPFTTAHVALAGVVLAAIVIQSAQVRLQLLDPSGVFENAFVYALPITVILTLQLFGAYSRSFAN